MDDSDSAALMQEIVRATRSLQHWAEAHGGCDKINVAMIGNIVPQLHVHAVARKKTDPAWPHPVWARGPAVRFGTDELQRRVAELSHALV